MRSAGLRCQFRRPGVRRGVRLGGAGGDGAGFRFTPEDWRKLAAEAGELAQQEGISWLVSTSRRTGGEGEDILRAGLPELVVADAVWWSTQPRRILQAYLGAADVVCCTADSLSMLTEAVLSGRPVIAWQPASARPNADYQAALERLAMRNLIVQSETLVQGAALLASRPAGTFDQQRLETRLIALCEAAS